MIKSTFLDNLFSLYFMNMIPMITIMTLLMIPKKLFSNNPLMMNMILCLVTLMYSLSMSLLSSTFWFSMIMFLMMIGGLLILFLYFTSISPNEFNNIPYNTMISLLMKISMIMLMIMLIMYYYSHNDYLIMNSWKKSNEINYNINNKMNYIFSSNFIYSYPIYKITLLIIIYLFYTLFIINKLCLNSKKPLRKFKN
uniref:NADH-ubiquinone oxidoreductase chain 6 n=1 Tax=Gasteruption sp. M19 TaxID=162239 RepID=A0A096XMY3_9HYME|nr:NADH dehydrogenase subunit 6 [Gasteruption sp. M19]